MSAGKRAERRRQRYSAPPQSPPRPACAECGKVSFPSRSDARRVARQWVPGERARLYECGGTGSGRWHLTFSAGAERSALYRQWNSVDDEEGGAGR